MQLDLPYNAVSNGAGQWDYSIRSTLLARAEPAKGFAASDVAHFRAPEKRNASNQDLKGHLPDWLQMDIAKFRW